MAKIKITETNGASAKDISDAIGRFLKDSENQANESDEEEEQ